MKNVCMIKAVLRWTKETQAVGIMFHIDGARMEQWCQLRLEISHNKIVFERSGKTEKDQFLMRKDQFISEWNSMLKLRY